MGILSWSIDVSSVRFSRITAIIINELINLKSLYSRKFINYEQSMMIVKALSERALALPERSWKWSVAAPHEILVSY